MLYTSLLARTLLCLATLAIGIGSLMPSSGISVTTSDKILHLIGYCGLTFLIGVSFPKWDLWKIIAIASVYGLLMEVSQGLLSASRNASALDALANLIGAIAGARLSLLANKLVSLFRLENK